MTPSRLPALWLALSCAACCAGQGGAPLVPVAFDRGYGQVEVGGPSVGVEFHDSRPLPSRISFFTPRANSIDVSTDYWRRGDSRPMVLGLQVDGGGRHWIGDSSWRYVLLPHTVTFHGVDSGLDLALRYEFCLQEPAMVVTLSLTNPGRATRHVRLYSHLIPVLRTCQSYVRREPAETESRGNGFALTATSTERDTGPATVILLNAGTQPSSWTTDGSELQVTDRGTSLWTVLRGPLDKRLLHDGAGSRPVLANEYLMTIAPGDSAVVIQVVASCLPADADSCCARLRKGWKQEIQAYDRFVRERSSATLCATTGDSTVDRSVAWAHAILATNAHLLDGVTVPMPCPAEYNFFFTHDVLLTDLAAVWFDTPRVKRDLLYITSHARSDVIPHAYYWRDTAYVTELCTPDNWNHLWFILVAGAYLRHSGDDATLRILMPAVTRSLREILQQKRDDNLMYAFRPDWWDIGRNEGPRTFITTLTIRALREYCALASFLGMTDAALAEYENTADAMQKALVDKLWDNEAGFLVNYNSGRKDTHYYMGSLLAPALGLLEPAMAQRLVDTAAAKLLEPRIGVRVAFPVDFNVDSVRSFFKFVDNEAGDPYLYANGGVWAHANAWYALARAATGGVDQAWRFLRTTMTIDGVLHSPNGYPAMYEYRYSNPDSSAFGSIDKPSFLWAAGFTLFTLYHLLGCDESEWNISVGNPRPTEVGLATCPVAFGSLHGVTLQGAGPFLTRFGVDGVIVPSRAVPLNVRSSHAWIVERGGLRYPYLDRINAFVHEARLVQVARRVECVVSSFDGHRVTARFYVPPGNVTVTLDGTEVTPMSVSVNDDGTRQVEITFTGASRHQVLVITY